MTWHPPEEVKNIELTKQGVENKKTRRKHNTHVRLIMHIDMDAFFAAIEQRDNPLLKGKPVIVGGIPGGRGVVSTCSYEAREYGIHSGMPIAEAERRCPHGIYLKAHGKKYTYAAVQLLEIFHNFTPVVEPVSIDEAYLDITNVVQKYGNEINLARELKKEIFKQLNLNCSIGIAYSRIFAKLASGMDKPDGLTIISKVNIEEKVYPLPVEKLWGIGEKTAEILHNIGIYTIGDLAVDKDNVLKKCFGRNGEHWKKIARGESAATVIPVNQRENEKSIGHEHTFGKDVREDDTFFKMLMKLSQKVGRRMRKRGFGGKTVTFKLRYSDFETHTHRETLPHLIWDDREIFEEGKLLFKQMYKKNRPIRLIGLSVSKLFPLQFDSILTSHQEDLFNEPYRKNEILPVMDSLRNKYGEKIISRFSGVI